MNKVLKWVLLAVFIIAVGTVFVILASDIYISVTSEKYIESKNSISQADCIIVPQTGECNGGEVTAKLKNRLETAINIYDTGVTDKIIVSGNIKENAGELELMKNYLIGRNIPAENIITDEYGVDTYTMVYRVRDIFKAKAPVFVDQKDQLLRTMYIADRLGLSATGVESRGAESSFGERINEYITRFKTVLMCEIFKTTPKHLGMPMPISAE